MKQKLSSFWLKHIYKQDKVSWWLYIFYPLSLLAKYITQNTYTQRVQEQHLVSSLGKPVWIIGNLTLGGTGKTPTLIAISKLLLNNGIQPGIITRGYGSNIENYPYSVSAQDNSQLVGDEALLLQQTKCPVILDPDRLRAAKYLINNYKCDVILSDDGLQHYNLPRSLELVVVDSLRLFGNKQLLPIGPLREPMSRLQDVDAVLVNHKNPCTAKKLLLATKTTQFDMYLQASSICSVDNTVTLTVAQWLDKYKHKNIHAISGIGNNESFFSLLESIGCKIISHEFMDHHMYTADDFLFLQAGDTVIITEKDAVKCENFKDKYDLWYLKVELKLADNLQQWLLSKILVK